MSDREPNPGSHQETSAGSELSSQPPGWQGKIARFFKFQDYRTTIRTEVLAGVTIMKNGRLIPHSQSPIPRKFVL